MGVHSVLTRLLNELSRAKRTLPHNASNAAAVYRKLNQAEGLVNGALNSYWRAATAAKTRKRPKPKPKESKK